MPLTSSISEYDLDWPGQFAEAASELVPTFGELLVEMHHIGSTAVPGLCAKPEIDILVVVATAAADLDWSEELSDSGYTRGCDLSVGHQFYKIDRDGIRTHKLHICLVGHEQIERMVRFRDMLRGDESLRFEYGTLKRELEQTNRAGITEYLERKDPFIQEAMAKRLNNEE